MNVRLVKRKKNIHVGLAIRSNNEMFVISVCNRSWCCDDKVEIADSSGVTCKRCIKYAREAESNKDGTINLKPIKSVHGRKANG